MFDISKVHLRLLNDSDLRELVARLCEAELGLAGIPSSAVKWGGAQTASDGGLDVDCQIEEQSFTGNFVRRARTGIQVKKSTMPASAIAKEMSPKGILRPIFWELARDKGCYVIVSLADDPAGPRLRNRTKRMRKQVREIPDHDDLRLEFYGRGVLANWLRQHRAVEIWVRQRLGIPKFGWRPFEKWTATPASDSDELICKSGVVITVPNKKQDKLSVVEGIEEIRQLIRGSDNAVRIVGLSGVGKTRIVQALFEESVGKQALDPHRAIYADLAESPTPSAREVIEEIVASGRPAVLVLDNCPSAAHSNLASLAAGKANIRLITVEYDIREDKPEFTDVVRIDAEGPGIAEALVKRRYGALGQVNAERIAQISDGNARLALALAATVDASESLSEFSDRQLFERLFFQAGASDDKLLEAAEVLSLVYSFSADTDVNGKDELGILAGLVDHTRLSLYRSVQQLVSRQLVQTRAHWRAVLPQALSDRLAARALERIPVENILAAFDTLASPRLLISFGKRLRHLHDHQIAQAIINEWISPGGRLYDFCNLQEHDIRLLDNVAPVAPETVLLGIERETRKGSANHFFSKLNPHYRVVADLLTSLAYEPDLFERCVRLLTAFALTEGDGERGIRDPLFSLFSLYFSGTLASPDQREREVRRLLASKSYADQKIGMEMLESALRTDHWTSSQSFEFGARPRSFGYEPATFAEQDNWFELFIRLAQEITEGDNVELSDEARDLLATHFRGLWGYPGLRATLADLAKSLNEDRPWLQGWRAVLSIKHFDCANSDGQGETDCCELLDKLDDLLRPTKLVDEIRAYVLSAGAEQFSLDEEFDPHIEGSWEETRQRAADRALDLGRTAARAPEVLEELSEELFTAPQGCLAEFGKGLAEGSSNLQELWNRLVAWHERAGDAAAQCAILIGVLPNIYDDDPKNAWTILDEAVQKTSLRHWIVVLHASIPIGPDGAARLLRALNCKDVPLLQFENVIYNARFDELSEEESRAIMHAVLDRPGGAKVVLSGLSTRLHRLKTIDRPARREIKKIGLLASTRLLRDVPSLRYNQLIGHNLSEVLRACLDEGTFPTETQDLLDAFFFRWNESYGMLRDVDRALGVLAEKATISFLDGIFVRPTVDERYRNGVFRERRNIQNPLTKVSVQPLLNWCEQGDFQQRVKKIAEIIFPFVEEPRSTCAALSDQARALIEVTTDPLAVLTIFSRRINPTVRAINHAKLIARRARAFKMLLDHERADIQAAANQVLIQMREWEDEALQQETMNDERREQTFE